MQSILNIDSDFIRKFLKTSGYIYNDFEYTPYGRQVGQQSAGFGGFDQYFFQNVSHAARVIDRVIYFGNFEMDFDFGNAAGAGTYQLKHFVPKYDGTKDIEQAGNMFYTNVPAANTVFHRMYSKNLFAFFDIVFSASAGFGFVAYHLNFTGVKISLR